MKQQKILQVFIQIFLCFFLFVEPLHVFSEEEITEETTEIIEQEENLEVIEEELPSEEEILPEETPLPTETPEVEPTEVPEGTPEPTLEPTVEPTIEPTVEPTVELTIEPTIEPTVEPTIEPTIEPTANPEVIQPTLTPATPEIDKEKLKEVLEKVSETVEMEVEPDGAPAIDKDAILNGSKKLTYGLFGAKGDGKTNDYVAIQQAHSYANNLYLETGTMVTVYGEKGKTYYISEASDRIDIITNVDWQGCTFIFDDYKDDGSGNNLIQYTNPIFDVVPDLKVGHGFLLNIELNQEELNTYVKETISPETKNVKGLIEATKANVYYTRDGIQSDFEKNIIWAAFIEDTSKRWIRKGDNQDTGANTGELITFNSRTGELLTDVDFTYNNIKRALVFPIRNQGISIGNANIITYTNNQVYPTSERNPYTYRGIRIRYTGNVNIHHINHELNEKKHPFTSAYQSNPNANFYYGILDLTSTAYVKLNTFHLTAHTPALKYGTSNTYEGSNDLAIQNAAYIYLDYLGYGTSYQRDILDESLWGTITTNQCKNVFLTNSVVNRMDAHRGITNLFISNTTLGVNGLTLIGQGDFYGENIIFDQASRPISLRQDYGASWDGSMYFKNITLNFPENRSSYLIYANNSENWDFGYTSIFPNLYIDGLSIHAKKPSNLTVLLFADQLKTTIDASKKRNLYFFKGDLQIKNINTSHIDSFKVFHNDFLKDSFNYLKSSYGGNNQVKVDVDTKIDYNLPTVNNPKFIQGKVTPDYTNTKNKFNQLYKKGLQVINTTDTSIPPTSLTLNHTKISLYPSEMVFLQPTITEKNANREVTYTSSNNKVASVDALGKVVAKQKGNTTITCRTTNGKVATCQITVLALPIPPLVAVYNSVRGIDLRWKAVPMATGYQIWRKNRGTWSMIQEIEGRNVTQYYDQEVKDLYGKIYVYAVAAKMDSYVSAYNTKGLGICRLPAPEFISLKEYGNQQAKLKWKVADKAQGYYIQYATNPDFKNAKYITVSGRNSVLGYLKNLQNGSKYYVRIRSYLTDTNKITYYSAWSSVRTLESGKEIAIPEMKAVYNSIKGVDVRWEATGDATGYDIYRKNRGVWTKVGSVEGNQTTQYFDQEVKTTYGKIYVYSVAARVGSKVGKYNEKGKGICRLKPPEIKELHDASMNRVFVRWTLGDKSDGYEIQYATKKDFSNKATIFLFGRNKLEEYIWELQSGSTYYIRIRSHMTDENGITYYSQYSAPKSIVNNR